MVTVQNWVTADEVLALLNARPPEPAFYATFLEAYWKGSPGASPDLAAELSADLREWVEEAKGKSIAFPSNYLAFSPTILPTTAPSGAWRVPDTISRECRETIGNALISAHLRLLVDEWLDTGRGQDQGENPSGRELAKAGSAWLATSEFLAQNPSFLYPDPAGGSLRLTVAEPHGKGLVAPDFFMAQKLTAERLFVGIIASDWQARLAKCRYAPCGKYFVSEKLRRHYRRGTFCGDEHRSHQSAERITRERRKRANLELVEIAARWLIGRHRTSAWQTDPIRKDLAAVLSQEMGRDPNLRTSREEVKVNWVTRNRAAIERRRSELSVQAATTEEAPIATP